MAQQYVQFQESKPDFSSLLENLAVNVAHRRAMEQKKAQQAQALENQMATGHAPKADFEITDDGLSITAMKSGDTVLRGKEASKAFYNAIGGNFGQSDMTQEAEATSQTTVSNPLESVQQQLQQAVQQQNKNAAAAELTNSLLRGEQLEMAGLTKTTGGPGVLNPKPGYVPGAPYKPEIIDALQRAMGIATDSAGELQDQATGATASSAEQSGTTPAAAVPLKDAENKGGTSLSAGAGLSQSQSERVAGKISTSSEVAGGIVSAPVYSITQNTSQGARLDEIKTDYNTLLGMSAFHQTFTGQADNLYSQLAKRRAEDLDRWEKTAKTSSTSIEKLGDVKAEVDGITTSSSTGVSEGTTNQFHIDARSTTKVDNNSGDKGDRLVPLTYETVDGQRQTLMFDATGKRLASGATMQLGTSNSNNEAIRKALRNTDNVVQWIKNKITTEDAAEGRVKVKKTSADEVIAEIRGTDGVARKMIFKNSTISQGGTTVNSWTVSLPEGLETADITQFAQMYAKK